MLKVAICDDEMSVVSQVEKLITDICFAEGISVKIQAFCSGREFAEKVIDGDRFDIICMDIQMDEGNGITAAENIRQADDEVLLIYISGYEKYMIELFRLDVFAFIRKPIDEVRFRRIILNAYERVCNKSVYFTYQYKNEEFRVLCKDILYFESEGRNIKIHTKSGETLKFNGKLNQVEERLQSGKILFLRIHQSFLVNYHNIQSRTKSFVKVKGDIQLPISEDRRKALAVVLLVTMIPMTVLAADHCGVTGAGQITSTATYTSTYNHYYGILLNNTCRVTDYHKVTYYQCVVCSSTWNTDVIYQSIHGSCGA